MHWRWCSGRKIRFYNKNKIYIFFLWKWPAWYILSNLLYVQEYDSKCLKMYRITLKVFKICEKMYVCAKVNEGESNTPCPSTLEVTYRTPRLKNYSKIPWYPKLLFHQRENALASFWVQRVLVTQPRPSQVMIKHNFLLWGILELKFNPRRQVYVEIPKPSRVSLILRQDPRLTPWVLTTF
jgi:hypothetical protein